MSTNGTIRVEVAYGEPGRQALLAVDLPAGSTVADAIDASGIAGMFGDLEVDPQRVGVFGRRVGLEYVLGEGDRVEIYRPLLADPKEVRRARARSLKG